MHFVTKLRKESIYEAFQLFRCKIAGYGCPVKILLVLIFLILLAFDAKAQNDQVGIGTTTPDPSAALDIVTSARGVLIPRMTTAQRDAIGSPATGLVIYNSTTNQFQYYNGTQWESVVGDGDGDYLLLSGGTMSGNIDLDANILENIGDASTDFTAGGGLNLADKLTILSGGAEFNGTVTYPGLTASKPLKLNALNEVITPARLELTDLPSLTASEILIGSTGGDLAIQTIYGDGGLAEDGLFTIQDNSVDGTDIQLTGNALGDIMYYDGTDWIRLGIGNNNEVLTSNGTVPIWAAGGGGGGGTVTSVGLDMPTQFTVTNSPVTTSGTLTAAWNSQNQNLIFASPDGASGVPLFRGLTDADIPNDITITNNVTGSGATNQIAFWTDTDEIGGNADFTYDGSELILDGTFSLRNTLNNHVSFIPDPLQNLDITYTLPQSLPGTIGYLQTDNSGNLSWQSISVPFGTVNQTGRFNATFNMVASNFLINTDLAIGMGDTDPDALLEISASGLTDDYLFISSDDNDDGDVFSIKNNGRVGIGIPNPTSPFMVSVQLATADPIVEVQNSGTGDASMLIQNASGDFTMGVDADGNNFEVSNSTTLTGTGYADANTMMTIHRESGSEGIIDFNNQSRVRALLTGSQSIADDSWTKVNFGSISYDSRSEFLSGTFTAKQTGYYQVNSRTEFALSGTGHDANSYVAIAIYKNAAAFSYGNNLGVASNDNSGEIYVFNGNNAPNVSDVIYLEAGQTIEIYVYQNTGSSVNITGGSTNTYVSIHKIS